MPENRIIDFDLQAVVSFGILILSTAILVFFIYRILYGPVIKILDERKDKIQKDIDNARISLEEANKMKADYTEKITDIESKTSEMLREATLKAKKAEETIVSEAKAEAERLKNAAIREIELSKERVKMEMKNQIIEISSLIASRYVESKIDEDLQNKLLDDSIKELGGATWLA